MRIVITLEGPQGCGKTRCAEALQGFIVHDLATLKHDAVISIRERNSVEAEPEETVAGVIVDGKFTQFNGYDV